MSQPIRPNRGRYSQQNQQGNTASQGGTVYSNQNGPQNIYNTTTNNTHNTNNQLNVTNHHNVIRRTHSRTGWAVLAILLLDVAFFLYGQAAYTGQPGDSGDLWRAGIFLALAATTGSLIRRWFRTR